MNFFSGLHRGAFFCRRKISYDDKSRLFDQSFSPGNIFYLQSHTLDHPPVRTLFFFSFFSKSAGITFLNGFSVLNSNKGFFRAVGARDLHLSRISSVRQPRRCRLPLERQTEGPVPRNLVEALRRLVVPHPGR